MRQATALSLKLVTYLVIFGVTMSLSGLSLPKCLILASVHTLLLWLADLIILPRFGPSITTVMDTVFLFLGTLLVLGAMGVFLLNPTGILLSTVLGTAFEIGFHRCLLRSAVIE